MKTKELIALLQAEDPTGETEVCVGNVDIHFVGRLPGYYDGCLQVLKRGEERVSDIVGVEIRSGGDKINIYTYSVYDAIDDQNDLRVTYDSDHAKKHYKEKIEKYRLNPDEE